MASSSTITNIGSYPSSSPFLSTDFNTNSVEYSATPIPPQCGTSSYRKRSDAISCIEELERELVRVKRKNVELQQQLEYKDELLDKKTTQIITYASENAKLQAEVSKLQSELSSKENNLYIIQTTNTNNIDHGQNGQHQQQQNQNQKKQQQPNQQQQPDHLQQQHGQHADPPSLSITINNRPRPRPKRKRKTKSNKSRSGTPSSTNNKIKRKKYTNTNRITSRCISFEASSIESIDEHSAISFSNEYLGLYDHSDNDNYNGYGSPQEMPYLMPGLATNSSTCSNLSLQACKLSLPSQTASSSESTMTIRLSPQDSQPSFVPKPPMIRVLSPIAENNSHDENELNVFCLNDPVLPNSPATPETPESPVSMESVTNTNMTPIPNTPTDITPTPTPHAQGPVLLISSDNEHIEDEWVSSIAEIDDNVHLQVIQDKNYLDFQV